jgi:predicted RNA-binding Zn ribbon-like protein
MVRERDRLDDLLVVANTRHGPGGHRGTRVRLDGPDHDHLADPAETHHFLVTHDVRVPDLPIDSHALQALRRVREAARGLLDDGARAADPALADVFAAARYRLAADGEMRADAPGWSGLVMELLPALVELAAQRDRLRICGNPLCRFVFVDRSRNGSRVWCEMAVCGNRAKGGRFRHRLDPPAKADDR